jgi:co-chaperonin GroES (HSP10)
MSKLNPLNGYLVLKPIEEEEQTVGNIIIPDLGKERPELGEVIATSRVYNYNSDNEQHVLDYFFSERFFLFFGKGMERKILIYRIKSQIFPLLIDLSQPSQYSSSTWRR